MKRYFIIFLFLVGAMFAYAMDRKTPYEQCEDSAIADVAEIRANACMKFNFGIDCQIAPDSEKALNTMFEHKKQVCIQENK